MNHRPTSAKLLARLRKETNGAAAADMEGRGLRYHRNYGVSQHTVRTVAKEFSPDHQFAKYLWQQPVRELKLAAVTIADPLKVTPDEIEFWMAGAENSELAENLASFLFAKTSLTDEILRLYGCSADAIHQYAALLSAARGDVGRLSVENILQSVENILLSVEKSAEAGSPALLRAAGLLISNAAANNDARIIEYIESLKKQDGEAGKALLDEIMI